jgi:hypothetical protein
MAARGSHQGVLRNRPFLGHKYKQAYGIRLGNVIPRSCVTLVCRTPGFRRQRCRFPKQPRARPPGVRRITLVVARLHVAQNDSERSFHVGRPSSGLTLSPGDFLHITEFFHSTGLDFQYPIEERFRFLHRAVLRNRFRNLTKPSGVMATLFCSTAPCHGWPQLSHTTCARRTSIRYELP